MSSSDPFSSPSYPRRHINKHIVGISKVVALLHKTCIVPHRRRFNRYMLAFVISYSSHAKFSLPVCRPRSRSRARRSNCPGSAFVQLCLGAMLASLAMVCSCAGGYASAAQSRMLCRVSSSKLVAPERDRLKRELVRRRSEELRNPMAMCGVQGIITCINYRAMLTK